MTFLDLQTEFAEMTLDTTTTWAVAGTLNKKALNKAFEFLYDRLKNTERVKRKIVSNTKTAVTVTNNVGTLPANFSNMDIVSISPNTDYNDTVELSPDIYYDWKITGASGTYSIVLEDNITPIYIRYVPIRTDMSANGDLPNLPIELHRSIVDFALVEYNRRIRDPIETANSLDLAEQYLNQRLSTLA